ncbi:hypothetical protein Moror_2798 [Moniliophthora roreri MCA 2997]|uniref:Uncharacterized protein n=1 Tax=Moniliophthora roreri (strain MCA 2997) TaxID=1381753 RepID=V2XFQ8_MONRO|nr:hypothetical protein Moror_2798 [Moniliophthora roreri MCA 2997]
MPVIGDFFDGNAPFSLSDTSGDSNGNNEWQWNTVTTSVIAFLGGSVLIAFLATLLARPKRWSTQQKERKGKELCRSLIPQSKPSGGEFGIPARVSVEEDHDDRFELKPRPLEPIHYPCRLEVLESRNSCLRSQSGLSNA